MGAMREDLWVELATNKEHPRHKTFVRDVKNTLFRVDYPQLNAMLRQRRVSTDEYPLIGAWDFTVDRESALRAYNEVLTVAKQQGYLNSKGIRPYSYDTFTHLDRSEVWWGFEFETGYHSKQARNQAIDFAWSIAEDGVTFDAEGEGEYASEITFSPAEQSKFLNGTAPAHQFMMHVAQNELGESSGYSMIGTHFNLSVPEVHSHGPIAMVLNNSIHHLVGSEIRTRLFGRAQLYAGCINQGEWIECKIFRTTYNSETWERYVRVCQALSKIALAARDVAHRNHSTTCTNLAAMVEDPDLAPVLENISGYLGYDSSGYVSENNSRY